MDQLITSTGFDIGLKEGIPIPLNLSIADFREPEKRQRNFSKEIDLPGTADNQQLFATAFNLTQVGGGFDFNSSAKVNCSYYKKGNKILPNAVLKLNKVIVLDGEITFKASLYSDFVDMYLLLSTIDVRDLDWSDYDHILNNANIEATWSAPTGTGYYYPLIERNSRPSITQWKNTEMIPYVYMVDVFKKCMEVVGQKFTSNFMEEALTKKILYGYGGGNYVDVAVSPTEQNNRKVLLDDGEINYSKTSNLQAFSVFSVAFSEVRFSSKPYQPTPLIVFNEAQDIYGQYVANEFTAKRSGNYKISTAGEIRINHTGTAGFVSQVYASSLRIRKNGVVIANITLNQTSADQTFTINDVTNISLSSGDRIECSISNSAFKYTATSGTVDREITTPTPLTQEFTCTDVSLAEGSTVEIGRFLPSMKCSDFVLGVIRWANLMVSDPDIYGVVSIEPMANFYQGTDVFTDISQEIDISKEIEIKPSANEYAKTLSYNWKTGTETDSKSFQDKWGHAYGNLSFDQPSFFAKGEQKIELPFGTIIPYQITPGLLLPRFIDIDNQGTKKTTSGVPRLMFRNELKAGEWQLVGSTTDNYSTYPSVHHFDDWEEPTFDLNFALVEEVFYVATVVTSVNSYSVYYEVFVNEIISKDGKFVQLYRKLNASQVKNLDWSKLLMWDGALFRFNKIIDFDSEITEITKIEMIKVLEASTGNRGAIDVPPVLPPGLYTKIYIDPSNSVGVSAKVLSNGAGNQVLETSKRIIG